MKYTSYYSEGFRVSCHSALSEFFVCLFLTLQNLVHLLWFWFFLKKMSSIWVNMCAQHLYIFCFSFDSFYASLCYFCCCCYRWLFIVYSKIWIFVSGEVGRKKSGKSWRGKIHQNLLYKINLFSISKRYKASTHIWVRTWGACVSVLGLPLSEWLLQALSIL